MYKGMPVVSLHEALRCAERDAEAVRGGIIEPARRVIGIEVLTG